MALFTWDDKFSVKVSEMDRQHKRLFDIINRLHDEMKAGTASKSMPVIVNELLDYTKKHFGQEEQLMKKHNFPGLAEQESLHRKFVAEIEKVKQDIDSGKPVFATKTMTFLKDWLLGHIVGIDKKYSDFLNEKGVK